MFGFWQSAQLRILKIQQRLEPTLNHAKKGKYKIGMIWYLDCWNLCGFWELFIIKKKKRLFKKNYWFFFFLLLLGQF